MKSSQDITPSPYIYTICGSTITAKYEAHAAVPHRASDLGFHLHRLESLPCNAMLRNPRRKNMQKQSKTPIIAFETKSNKWLFCSSRNNAVLSWVQTKFSTVSASPGQNYTNKIQFQRGKKNIILRRCLHINLQTFEVNLHPGVPHQLSPQKTRALSGDLDCLDRP